MESRWSHEILVRSSRTRVILLSIKLEIHSIDKHMNKHPSGQTLVITHISGVAQQLPNDITRNSSHFGKRPSLTCISYRILLCSG